MIVAPVSSLQETEVCSTTKCHQNKSDLKYVFVQKSFFFNIYSFNHNHAYWNQRRLFSGNLPGMFILPLRVNFFRKINVLGISTIIRFSQENGFQNFENGLLIPVHIVIFFCVSVVSGQHFANVARYVLDAGIGINISQSHSSGIGFGSTTMSNVMTSSSVLKKAFDWLLCSYVHMYPSFLKSLLRLLGCPELQTSSGGTSADSSGSSSG